MNINKCIGIEKLRKGNSRLYIMNLTNIISHQEFIHHPNGNKNILFTYTHGHGMFIL